MLTEKQKIAKDVLKWLKAKKLTAKHCVYFRSAFFEEEVCKKLEINNWAFAYNDKIGPLMKKQANEVVDFSQIKNCEVCALGATFIAAVDRNNKLKFRDFLNSDDSNSIASYLKPWFPQKELVLIESAFELDSNISDFDYEAGILHWASVDFGHRYNEPDQRLEAIMKTIISHGKFSPLDYLDEYKIKNISIWPLIHNKLLMFKKGKDECLLGASILNENPENWNSYILDGDYSTPLAEYKNILENIFKEIIKNKVF